MTRLANQRRDFQYALLGETSGWARHAEGRHRPAGVVEERCRHAAQPVHRFLVIHRIAPFANPLQLFL